MRRSKSTKLTPPEERIPRIQARQAAKILADCEHLLRHIPSILRHLRGTAFAEFLASMTEDMLRLAIQPDTWGERLRGRLMSEIAPALQGDAAQQLAVSIDDIAYCSNIVMPCFLLELGRRKRHIAIEFPADPTDSSARFKLSVGASHPSYSIRSEQLLHLVSKYGEDLVGLCYFGDDGSRRRMESALNAQSKVRTLKVRPSGPSSNTLEP